MKSSGTDGFSLPEVLISLVIAMLLMTAVTHAFGPQTGRSTNASEKVNALILARSLLSHARMSKLERGTHYKGASDDYLWEVDVATLPFSLSTKADLPSNSFLKDTTNAQEPIELVRVTAVVATPSGQQQRLTAIIAQRPLASVGK